MSAIRAHFISVDFSSVYAYNMIHFMLIKAIDKVCRVRLTLRVH